MHLFSYPNAWAVADTVASQIAASRGTRCTEVWGYGCIVVGKQFEKALLQNWQDVDRLAGPYLHVFSFVAPPMDFIGDRMAKLRALPKTDDTRRALGLLEDFINMRPPDKSTQIREKVMLLQDLQRAGLKPDERADFLFFDFRNEGFDVEVELIAFGAAGINSDAPVNDCLCCFEQMGNAAEKASLQRLPASGYISMLNRAWSRQVMIKAAPRILEYIKKFLSPLSP